QNLTHRPRPPCRCPQRAAPRRIIAMPAMSFEDGAHLLRRMGFGGSPDDINQLPLKSRDKAVDSLLSFESIDNSAMEDRLAKTFNPKKFTPQDDLQLWWVLRMV